MTMMMTTTMTTMMPAKHIRGATHQAPPIRKPAMVAITGSLAPQGMAVVVIMVMQIAGSSGTFPIELLPAIYQKIYRFFPFPYAIDAMRECICGMYGNYYWQQIGFLLLFAAAALLIGLLVRRPFMGLNRFMEEKLEETELL